MPVCAACNLENATFSRGQLKKGSARRCTTCVGAAVRTSAANTASSILLGSEAHKVPKLLAHELAAQLVARVEQGGGGVRTNLYNKGTNIPNKLRPVVTALVSEVVKCLPALQHALASVPGPWTQGSDAVTTLAKVLLHEMVVKERSIKGGAKHPLARAMWERRVALKAAMETSLVPVIAPPPQRATPLPRYVRVNTLKASVCDAKASLVHADAKLVATDDPFVPLLLRLPPKSNLHGHALIEEGKLILQDRASCLPALALAPPPGACVIDACAAPGNKTTQLAAAVGKAGTIYAFERNRKRAATLRGMVGRAGASSIVQVHETDFTAIDTSKSLGPATPTMALCDPSCSGSGGAGGHAQGIEHESSPAYWDNVRRLAAAQLEIIRKAFAFPHMRVVVYSTCSIHREENEDVVGKALEAAAGEWRLVLCLPDWPTRGLCDTPTGALCVRAGDCDDTHGFFVARFERVQH